MKYFVLVISSLFILSTAHGYGFQANANVFVNRTVAEVSVYNYLNRPIACNGRAVGVTASGHNLFSYMNVVIYPGTSGYVYIYTNNYNPFINAYANIFCNTL